jgi:hypothetical protein
MAEMRDIAEAAAPISGTTEARIARGEALRRGGPAPIDRAAVEFRLAELMSGVLSAELSRR